MVWTAAAGGCLVALYVLYLVCCMYASESGAVPAWAGLG